ncbi:MAG TPA: hypothetical protein VEF76_02680 [Patescibacteria group bacterium]|nr:hypothetical protein [Patescibacteria group bacterium]
MQIQTGLSSDTTPHPAQGGYYTVNLEIDGKKLPYVVFAVSEFDAARKVKYETGCLVHDTDVEGPFQRYL